jgi:hypothetical protein
MPRFFAPVLLTILLLVSCTDQKVSEEPTQNVFFSLKDYIEAEADRLNEQQTGLNKTIVINDKSEQREVSGIDFHQELSLFSKADINKLAWADKYEVDTVFYASHFPQSIHYKAVEAALKTQEIHLYFQENQTVDSIRIRSKSETVLASNENWLQFTAATGYHILTAQDNLSGNPARIEVTSVFTTKK